MARKRKRVKVTLRPLGRERAVGQAFQGDSEIEVDFRVKPKYFLQINCHEVAHLFFCDESEHKINEFGKHLSDVLWRVGFRRIYDENKLMSPRPKTKKKSK